MAFVSSSNNNTSSTNEAVNTAHGVSTASTQVNAANSTNIDNLSDVVILQSSKKSRQQQQQINLKKECACGNIYFHKLVVLVMSWGYDLKCIRQREGLLMPHRLSHLQILTQSLNKLIECQIVDNCKKGLGYENYNAVPPPYTGNFMPPTPDLSFTGLDEFVNEPVVENCKAMSSEEEPKVVRKNDDTLIIKEWVSDDEEEDVSQPKIEKKTVMPSIIKKEFVKSKQQQKTNRKTIKQVEQHRQNTHSPRGNQRNWNNMMSQKLESNFEMFNKACYVCGSFDHLQVDCNYHQKQFKSRINMVPRAVLMNSGLVSVNTARQVNTAHSKIIGNAARPMPYLSKTAHSTNIVPKGGLTCLFAKATSDESKLWHRRLGHLNFKTMNKLVKGNLVRGLPSKLFENDQTCVACQKGRERTSQEPLPFGRQMYCLVVTDDYSRFTWVFFLATKNETNGILKSFITGIENLVDHKVKVVRCDNGTKFKNREMNQFCEMKGILRQFSVARTPQQNGVAERRNMTLIEAARTMLADSKLPTTFWAEAVNTACYVQNRVLVVKPHNKTPYELFHSRTPTLSFMRPFGCPVTILNTIDHLGKFDGKANKDPKSSHDDGSKPLSDDGKKIDEDPRKESECNDQEKEYNISNTNNVNDAGTNEVNGVGGKTSIELPFDPNMSALEDYSIFDVSRDDEDDGAEADNDNLDTNNPSRPISTIRIHKIPTL
ncbi:putative ribonuclease H-like domain-containing protein [Tanacetum coccineum]